MGRRTDKRTTLASYFTFLWTNECCRNMIDAGLEGQPLDRAAGSKFLERGCGPKDYLYILNYLDGQTYLIGRMRIKKIWQRKDWDKAHDDPDLWPGDEVAEGENGTAMRFDRVFRPWVLGDLVFTDWYGKEFSRLKLTREGQLASAMSIRSVRRIIPASGQLLNRLLTEDYQANG